MNIPLTTATSWPDEAPDLPKGYELVDGNLVEKHRGPESRTSWAEEFPDVPKGFELVDGELVEKHMGFESGYIGLQLGRVLANHCASPLIGWVNTDDASFQLFPDRPKLIRKPDISFVRLGRFPQERMPTGHAKLAPDLAVEVVSPNDLYYEVDKKVAEYREAGVPLIWIISPPSRTILVRRRDGSVSELLETGELSGEDVIPGFVCRVADLFPPAPANPS